MPSREEVKSQSSTAARVSPPPDCGWAFFHFPPAAFGRDKSGRCTPIRVFSYQLNYTGPEMDHRGSEACLLAGYDVVSPAAANPR